MWHHHARLLPTCRLQASASRAPPLLPYSSYLATVCDGKAEGTVVLVTGGFDVCPAPPAAKGHNTAAIAAGAAVGGAFLLGVLVAVAILAVRRRRAQVQQGVGAAKAEYSATPRSPQGATLTPVQPSRPAQSGGEPEDPSSSRTSHSSGTRPAQQLPAYHPPPPAHDEGHQAHAVAAATGIAVAPTHA